jgi:hypothetical protein
MLLNVINLLTHYKAYKTIVYRHIKTLFDMILKRYKNDTNIGILSTVNSM